MRVKLYRRIILIFSLGYLYLFYTLLLEYNRFIFFDSFCIFKKLFQIPCPSCGSTRAIISILQGRFLEAFQINPLGFIAIFLLTITPILFLVDIVFKKNYFDKIFQKIEALVNRTPIAITLTAVIIVNWVWNIYKGI